MNSWLSLSMFMVALVQAANSINIADFQEGSCAQFKPQANVNTTWLSQASLPYLSGGSRYHLYRIASGHPQIENIREFEFNYESCLQSYVNTTTGVGLVYGFGLGIIGNYDVRYTDRKGVIDFVPLPTPGMDDVSRQYITLTDNKNFVFFANCWQGSNQRGWSLITRTPTLDSKTQRLIEDHAKSLGFDRMNFVFLRYNSCTSHSPVPGSTNYRVTYGRKTSAAGLVGERMYRDAQL